MVSTIHYFLFKNETNNSITDLLWKGDILKKNLSKIDYKKVKEFLDDGNLPIDHVFQELESFYDSLEQDVLSESDEDNTTSTSSSKEDEKKKDKKKEALKEALKAESDSLKQDFKSAYERGKAQAKTKYTEAEEKRERERQLLINERLQQEVYRNASNLRDNNYAIAAARDPRAYMAQNKASLAVIPRDQRAMMMPVGGQPPANVAKGAMSALGTAMGGLRFLQGNMYLLMFVFGLPNMLDGLGKSLLKFVTFIWNSLSGNDIANATATGFTKEGRLAVDINKAKLDIADKNATKIAGALDQLDGEERKATEDLHAKYDKQRTEAQENIRKLGEETNNTKMWEHDTGWLSYYGLSRIIRYIVIAIIIYIICNYLYKKIKQNNIKKKKEQYAQANNIAMQEITIPMLCEVSEEDSKYFKGMELIDESIGDWVKNVVPTPTNLLKLVNKGIISMGGLSKNVQVGLKNNSISPWLAKFCNIVIGLGNTIFMIVKGILLGLIASFKNKATVTNNKIEVNTLTKDNTNA